jgi:hypothetical protein
MSLGVIPARIDDNVLFPVHLYHLILDRFLSKSLKIIPKGYGSIHRHNALTHTRVKQAPACSRY